MIFMQRIMDGNFQLFGLCVRMYVFIYGDMTVGQACVEEEANWTQPVINKTAVSVTNNSE